MAHEIYEPWDIVLSIAGTEWHGLAQVLKGINRQNAARILFPILEAQPSWKLENGKTIPGDGYKALIADLSDRLGTAGFEKEKDCYVPLEVHNDTYGKVENGQIFDMATKSFEGLGCKITTAGTLDKLKKFFLSVDIGDTDLKLANGDKLQNFVNFISSHDGSYPLEIYDSSIRIVCMNTFRWSREAAGELGVRMLHTKNVADRLEGIPELLQAMIANRKKLKTLLNHLLKVECSPSQAAYLAAGYFARPVVTESNEEFPETLSTQAYNRATAIRDLAQGGKGNRGKTLYDAWNGFTEFMTHGEVVGGKKASAAKRISAARFGQAAEHKDNFLDLISSDDNRKEYMEAGEKLFRDKEKKMLAGKN